MKAKKIIMYLHCMDLLPQYTGRKELHCNNS